jgi:hypothetical protein
MISEKKLRGTISFENDRSLKFHSTLYDGTPFDLQVDQFDVQLNEDFRPSRMTVAGFLFVRQEAQQGSICYLTLPKPHIAYGKQITVKDIQLMARNVKLEDFNPQKNISVLNTPSQDAEI